MQLHDNPMPEKSVKLLQIWDAVFQNKDHHVIVAEEGRKIVSSCVCVIIPNLTHNQQPYAFVENVINKSPPLLERRAEYEQMSLDYF